MLGVPSDVPGRSRLGIVDEDDILTASPDEDGEASKVCESGEAGGLFWGEDVSGASSGDSICDGGGSMPVANLQKVAIAR